VASAFVPAWAGWRSGALRKIRHQKAFLALRYERFFIILGWFNETMFCWLWSSSCFRRRVRGLFLFCRILGHRHFFFFEKESTLPLPVAARRRQCVSELTPFTKSFANCTKKKEECLELAGSALNNGHKKGAELSLLH